jgi:hypothetical protein
VPGPEPRTLFSPPPPAAELSHSERLACLLLIRSENVGPVTFRDLIAHFGSAEAALDAMPELSRRGGFRRAIRLCTLSEAESELERAGRTGAELLFMTEARYPTPLTALDAPAAAALRSKVAWACSTGRRSLSSARASARQPEPSLPATLRPSWARGLRRRLGACPRHRQRRARLRAWARE